LTELRARLADAEQAAERAQRQAGAGRGAVARRLTAVEEARADVEPRLDALSAALHGIRESIAAEPEIGLDAGPDPAELERMRAEAEELRAQLDELAERKVAESKVVKMVSQAEAEKERERRESAEAEAARAAEQEEKLREQVQKARALIAQHERQEGALAARLREERETRERLEQRLASVAAQPEIDKLRDEFEGDDSPMIRLTAMERRIASIKSALDAG
jgi:chromosome segregation ATPase